ncbi:MAG: lipoate--protein ligase family protein [Verrucomicrobia bacterium]|nr:lipoate--protein ligase family protein [Verrucomicrobiota bacterium]
MAHDSQTWLLLNSGPKAAAYNMAFDEALLGFARALGRPVLRFYGWTEPAASFGYSQKYAVIASLTLLRPLVRRPTGGGLVPHNADWTYSLTFPPDHDWCQLRATESYARVHRWLQRAFVRLNLETELAPVACHEAPGQCFVGAEQSDLLWQGRKIAGAAQRRNRLGLLIQGSVQPPPVRLAKADWQCAMCDSAVEQWRIRWQPFEPRTDFTDRIEELLQSKYSRPDYHQQR